MVNTSIGKTFSITESVRFDLRLDAFNAFNHVNYNNPNTNIASPDFGKILSIAPTLPRQAQIAGRLTF